MPHAPAHEFQRRTVDQHMDGYFLTRFPPEGRSERDAHVGVAG